MKLYLSTPQYSNKKEDNRYTRTVHVNKCTCKCMSILSLYRVRINMWPISKTDLVTSRRIPETDQQSNTNNSLHKQDKKSEI